MNSLHFFGDRSLIVSLLFTACTVEKDLLTAGAEEVSASAVDDMSAGTTVPTGTAATEAASTEATGTEATATEPAATEPAATDTTAAEDTSDADTMDPCDTDCDADGEDFECVRALGWNGGPIGVALRSVTDCADCDEHETAQTVLVSIDPVTNVRSELGAAGVHSWGDTMAVAGDGSIFVGGRFQGVDEFADPEQQLHKFSPTGALLWTIQPAPGNIADLAVRGDEVVLVDADIGLHARSTVDGGLLWAAPDTKVEGYVEVDPGGAIYIAGSVQVSEDPPLFASSVRKFAADNTLVWDVTSEPEAQATVKIVGLAFDEAGGVVLALRSEGEPDKNKFRKLDASGAEAWSVVSPEIATAPIRHLSPRPGGGAIAVGQRNDEAFTVAIDAEGTTVWTDFKPEGEFDTNGNFAAVVGDGKVLVSGCALHGPPGSDKVGWLLSFTP